MNVLVVILFAIWMLQSIQGEPLIIPAIVIPSMELPAMNSLIAFLVLFLFFTRGLLFTLIDMPRTIKKVIRARRIKNLKIDPLDWIG